MVYYPPSGHRTRLAKALTAARHKKHLKQAELAEHLHVHMRSIAGWETGQTIPGLGHAPTPRDRPRHSLERLAELRWQAMDERTKERRRQQLEQVSA